MLIDLHVHSKATAGCDLDPGKVLAKAEQLGLDAVAFTDLNSLSAANELLAVGQGKGVKVFVGVELATDHGHYLAFFPEPTNVPEPAQLFGDSSKGWPAREVLEKVASLGGVAIAAHPYDRDVERPSGDYIFTLKDRLVGIEGLNGQRKPGVNDLAVEASEHMALPCTGGSGAKGMVDEVGKAATWFKDDVTTHAELVAALKAGQFFPVGAGRPPALSELARAPKNTGERFDRGDRGDRGGRDRDRRGGRGGGRDRRGGRGGGRDRR